MPVDTPDDRKDTGEQRELSRQLHVSLESYLADPTVQTGDILEYGERQDASWILGDVTPAYDSAKVKSFARRVVFLEGR